MKYIVRIVCTFTLAMVIALPAAAGIIQLQATLNGAQANAGAGSGSPGTGSAAMTYDTTSNLFTWEVLWTDLLAPVIAAHFHGAALPTQNAGVQVPIGLISPDIGAAILSDPQAADLLAGLWYINVHTEKFPPGEIRGQVRRVPEPGTLGLLGAGLLALGLVGFGMARRRGK